MVQKIRSSIISVLTIINFIGIIIFFISISQYNSSYSHKGKISQNNYNSYFYEKNNTLINNTNDIFLEKERKAKLLHYSFSKYYFISILTLNLMLFYFCFSLLFSFCIGDVECQCNNCCCRCCCDGGCGGCDLRSGDNENGIIACLIIIIFLIIIYFSTKLCGKHLSRYISLSFISFIYFSIFVISLLSINVCNSTIKSNIFISAFYFICNLSGMILPNLNKCEYLRYGYNQSLEVTNFPQYPQIQNNRIAININNSYNKNKRDIAYNVPIVKNEYNNSFQKGQLTDGPSIGNNDFQINNTNSK